MLKPLRNVTGASCQLYGHSCLGGHGKRSGESTVASTDSFTGPEMDSVQNIQNRLAANRMNTLMKELMARRMFAAMNRQPLLFDPQAPLGQWSSGQLTDLQVDPQEKKSSRSLDYTAPTGI